MKVPYNELESYNQIIEQELRERSEDFILKKILRSNSTIYSTEDLSKQYTRKIKNYKNAITFCSNSYLIFLMTFSFFWSCVLISLIFQLRIDSPLLILTSVFIAIGVYYYNIKRLVTLEISTHGIQIKGQHYIWQEIYKIYFISRPQGRGNATYIIFVIDTGLWDKYEITSILFTGSESKIAAYIEYYKNSPNKSIANSGAGH